MKRAKGAKIAERNKENEDRKESENMVAAVFHGLGALSSMGALHSQLLRFRSILPSHLLGEHERLNGRGRAARKPKRHPRGTQEAQDAPESAQKGTQEAGELFTVVRAALAACLSRGVDLVLSRRKSC